MFYIVYIVTWHLMLLVQSTVKYKGYIIMQVVFRFTTKSLDFPDFTDFADFMDFTSFTSFADFMVFPDFVVFIKIYTWVSKSARFLRNLWFLQILHSWGVGLPSSKVFETKDQLVARNREILIPISFKTNRGGYFKYLNFFNISSRKTVLRAPAS